MRSRAGDTYLILNPEYMRVINPEVEAFISRVCEVYGPKRFRVRAPTRLCLQPERGYLVTEPSELLKELCCSELQDEEIKARLRAVEACR